ncbi:hypothetical protein Ac2012v2_004192 [Leucoagaricus gongylophorus]
MAEMRKAASFRRARKRYEQKKAAKCRRLSLSLPSFFCGKGCQKGKLLSRSSGTQSSRSKGYSPQLTTRKPEFKSSPNNAVHQNRSPLRSRPKAKSKQGSSRRPVHGRS